VSKLIYNLVEYLKGFVVNERKELFENRILQRTKHLTIVLENIFQGRNISASIRSADCFGIQDVHIIENDNIFNDDSEVSMGAEKWITTFRYNNKKNNTVNALKDLKSKGYQIIVTTPHNTNCNLDDLDVTNKIALVFGSEVKGCSEEALKYADKRMRIPSYGFTESFNVSVSVSLCLQHLTHKMRKTKVNWNLTLEQQNKILLKWLRSSIKASKEIEDKFLSEYNS
tara:strand:+ start:478 stop:1158 length:681 start_codon:yes stop_codon:yes gene_type:complete